MLSGLKRRQNKLRVALLAGIVIYGANIASTACFRVFDGFPTQRWISEARTDSNGSFEERVRKNVALRLKSAGVVTAGENWRVAVVLIADREFLEARAASTQQRNLRRRNVERWRYYCGVHGYSFIHVDSRSWVEEAAHTSEARLLATLEVLPGFDYVVQVSLDTVVVNMSQGFGVFVAERPDVVLSIRSSVWGGMRISRSTFPKETFRNAPKTHPHMLHTECIVLRNSQAAVSFAKNVLAFSDLVGQRLGYDMDAIQYAALRFLPQTEEVVQAQIFGLNLSRGVPAFWKDGVYGHRGPFVKAQNDTKSQKYQNLYAYYKLSTDLIGTRRVWDGLAGRLLVEKEGKLLRDSKSGPFYAADFLVHTKIFYKRNLSIEGDLCSINALESFCAENI